MARTVAGDPLAGASAAEDLAPHLIGLTDGASPGRAARHVLAPAASESRAIACGWRRALG